MSKSRGYIDFAAVKAATTLEQVLEHYGILAKLKGGGASLRGCCPIHKGTHPTQFSVTLSKNSWNCFSECEHGGNHMDFVVKMENCTLMEAAWLMNDWFNLGHESKPKSRPPSERSQPPPAKAASSATNDVLVKSNPPIIHEAPALKEPEDETGENPVLTFSLDNLDANHPYLTERGLSAETIAHFGIGHCKSGIMAGRIAIPIHNAKGKIVGNAGRWPGSPPDGKEKYRLPGKFRKLLELYNAHRAFAEPAEDTLWIVEGFFDVFHLWQTGNRKVVALMGTHLSTAHEALLKKHLNHDSRIIVSLDDDDAGHKATSSIIARLAAICFVQSRPVPHF